MTIYNTKKTKRFTKILLSFGFLSIFVAVSVLQPKRLESANLTSVKDSLQSARMSVSARVDSTGTASGGSIVKLKTSGTASYYTISTANLHAGDAITIDGFSYTIIDIMDADEFTVTPVLDPSDVDDNDPIIWSSKPQHIVTFDTASAVADGYFKILIAGDVNTAVPDDAGFSFGGGSVSVSASDTGNYDFVNGVATASAGTDCTSPANYHCFEVHYSGNGGIGTTIVVNIGETGGSNTPIAPAPKSTHSEATADSYTFIVRNYDANDVLIDATTGKIALIEAVRVTATVEPTIAFTIAGIGTGVTSCGDYPDIDTTSGTNAPLAVPFGSLVLNTFKDASHNLTVSTNASSGYVVTAAEDDELGKDGGTSSIIADTPGDSTASETNADDWETATNNGFGFSIHNVTADTVPFTWEDNATDDCNDNIGADFCARQFANIAGPEDPQTIFSSSTVANAENINICYRISIGATQAAGDYENIITYTATGTF